MRKKILTKVKRMEWNVMNKKVMDKSVYRRRRRLWLTLFITIVIIDFLIPYTILKDIASFYASYMFWTVLTLITMILSLIHI
ncbi:MAG: hypothetical protein N3F06_04955 [Nitrososphaerales archaeon]|nr:hypothetical protein [Nitrososphaerales archaeon]